jgi:hypothetical protein
MKKIVCVLALSLFLLSCKKDRGHECFNTIIFWGGDPAADGPGWYMSTSRYGSPSYLADNLPAEFQADSTPVRVCLSLTDKKFPCRCPDPPPLHHVESISRR